MKKSTLFAALLAGFTLASCSKPVEPSTKPGTDDNTEPSVKPSDSVKPEVVPVTSVEIAGDTEVSIGKEITLTATVAPENATDKTVTWSTSDETKATITADGKVKGLAEGEVTITATSGEKKATHTITVKAVLPKGCKIKGELQTFVGTNVQLTYDIWASPTDRSVVWSSSNEEVATVDQNGLVTPVSVGETNIKIVSNALDSISYTAVFKVVEKPVQDDSVLIISEYMEGKSNNKWLEITNISDVEANLAQYKLGMFSNGASKVSSSITLSGKLAAGESIVIYNDKSDASYKDVISKLPGSFVNNDVINFNGDDAIALYKNEALVDLFGVIGEDPGSAWTGEGYTTKDKTWVRNADVLAGNTTWTATEWTLSDPQTMTDLGKHTVTKA